MQERLPVFVLTGFLGAGKTTLLNRLVNHPDMADSAVVINEFGETGIDHLLVETALENAVLMRSGCVCCTVRGDLVDTLGDLIARRDGGDLPPFNRVMVETTGIADPAPVIGTLTADMALAPRFRVGGVVTVVDAVHGLAQIAAHAEARTQVALADRLVLSKSDLCAPQQAGRTVAALRTLNPSAPLHRVIDGDIEPARLFEGPLYDPGDAPSEWIGAHHGVHGPDIGCFCITRETPMPWRAVRQWLDSLVSLHGERILRIKAILDIEGQERPLIVHGVHHMLHPPWFLKRWPAGTRQSQIVFICRDLKRNDVAAALDGTLAAWMANAA